jgi:FG-GAP-like repeat/Secretion system C-terminal sorting domain
MIIDIKLTDMYMRGVCQMNRIISFNHSLFYLLVSLLFVFSAFGQIEFIPHTAVTDLFAQQDSKCIDFDGDGDIDVVGLYDEFLSVWLNDDSNNYTEMVIDSSGYAFVSKKLDVADIDSDGDLDVVKVDFIDDELIWWENQGTNQFSQHNIIINNEILNLVKAADFDEDGDMDIVTTSDMSNTIILCENNGNEDFAFTTFFQGELSSLNCLVVSDVDSDGDIDIVASSRDDNKIVWIECEQGSYLTHIVSNECSDVFELATDDIDSDGDIDIVCTKFNEAEIVWFENDGFQDFTEHLVAESVGQPHQIDTGDLDGDGETDIVVTSNSDNEILWYRNDGEENFTQAIVTDRYAGTLALQVLDINNDGTLDIFSCHTSTIKWWMNNGPPLFTTTHTLSNTFMGASCVSAVDWEGDGDMDIAATAYEDDEVAIFVNNGNNPPLFTPHPVGTDFNGAWYVTTADLDFDHDMDVLAAAQTGDEISIWIHEVSWTFSQYLVTENFDGAYACEAADFDNDGDMDIVGVAKNSNQVSWFENSGDFAFSEHVLTTDLLGARALALGDLDGDGDIDIVAGGGDAIDDGELRWWQNSLNSPEENFIEATIHELGENYRWATLKDMDDDGHLDILTTAYGSDRMIWWRNQLDGPFNNFDPIEIDDNFNGAMSIDGADFDGDGDMDVAGAAWLGQEIAWWEDCDEDGYFKHILASGRNRARCVIATDIDGDGDQDVVSAVRGYDGGEGSVIEWYENISLTTYHPPRPFSLLEPDDGSVVTTGDITLTWEETTDLDPGDLISYVVWTATDQEFTENVDSTMVDTTSYTMFGLNDQTTYWWKVRAQDNNTPGTWSTETWSFSRNDTGIDDRSNPETPTEWAIASLYPNPFNPTLNVSISLPEVSDLKVKIYNVMGQSVATLANDNFSAGIHSFVFNGNRVTSHASGIYFVHASVPGKLNQVRKVVLMK